MMQFTDVQVAAMEERQRRCEERDRLLEARFVEALGGEQSLAVARGIALAIEWLRNNTFSGHEKLENLVLRAAGRQEDPWAILGALVPREEGKKI